MREYGVLVVALGVCAVIFGAYFSRAPLERWHKRLEQDLERLRAGPSSGKDK